MSNDAVEKWADPAMFHSEPMPEGTGAQGPRVYLLNMTPDPLGAIAASSMMYEGKVVRNLSDVSDEQRNHYLAQILKTHLKAPFEFVDMHFMIEGVTRSFTHQMVRQRTAVYCQESMRFAVKENMDAETPLPPSLAGKPSDDPMVRLWRKGINNAQDIYEALIAAGVPAEDARGLMPHQTTTRLHYKTNLRGLYEHLGNRLCTQAQFEWKAVATGIVNAIRNYHVDGFGTPDWQQQALADIFRPICYLTGKCEFNAVFDRSCSIKARVNANHEIGRESSQWDKEHDEISGDQIVVGAGQQSVIRDEQSAMRPVFIGAIQPAEWLMDPTAARRG